MPELHNDIVMKSILAPAGPRRRLARPSRQRAARQRVMAARQRVNPFFGLAYMKAKKKWGPVFQGKYFKTFFGGLICPIRGPVWGPIPGPEIDHNHISKGDAIVALVTSLSSQIMILYHFFETPKSP